MALPDHEHECFLISPIGDEGSAIRERADGVRDFIVKPAVEALDLGLEVVRADDIAKPGQITLDVIDHVLNAKVAVADLTGLNPNVFYELAARHAAQLPVVLIAHEDQIKGLPFDIQQMRTVSYDDSNLSKAAKARDAITEHLKAGLDGAVDSPLAAAVNLEALRAGSSSERVLADLLGRVDELANMQRQTFGAVRRDRLETPVWARPLIEAQTLARDVGGKSHESFEDEEMGYFSIDFVGRNDEGSYYQVTANGGRFPEPIAFMHRGTLDELIERIRAQRRIDVALQDAAEDPDAPLFRTERAE